MRRTNFRLLAPSLCLGIVWHFVTLGGASAESPVGVFSSGTPTTAVKDSVDSRLEGRDYIDGALVRIGWDDIEISPGVYDWSRLDAQFDRADDFNLQISLGVVNGQQAPAWLAGAGAEMYSYYFPPTGATVSMPVPWDDVFLSEWTEFVAALGARYRDEPALALVHITTSSGNGFEMQLPSTPTDVANWNAIGYSVERHVDAYEEVIDAFNDAFPETPLDLEIHPVLGSDAVAEQTVAYSNDAIGDRFGVFAAWWSQHNADDVYPGMYDLLKAQAAKTFAGVQLVTNSTRYDSKFGDGGIQEAIDRAYADGVRYFEPWDIDLLNAELTPMFNDLHADVHVAALNGDFNFDGFVDGADFLEWQRLSGSAEQLDAWKSNFGASMTPASVRAVPEPTTLLPSSMAAIACAHFLRRTHGRQK